MGKVIWYDRPGIPMRRKITPPVNKSWPASKKEVRKFKVNQAKSDIIHLELNGYETRRINQGRDGDVICWRICERLDIYPINSKWHDIILDTRGSYTGSIFDFCRSYLENHR